MRNSDCSSDLCSSDLKGRTEGVAGEPQQGCGQRSPEEAGKRQGGPLTEVSRCGGASDAQVGRAPIDDPSSDHRLDQPVADRTGDPPTVVSAGGSEGWSAAQDRKSVV